MAEEKNPQAEPNNTGPKRMVYKDPETGAQLYGFSQVSLDRIYKLLWVLVIILIVFAIMAGYVLWKVEAYNIVGKYISRCVGV